MNAREQARFDAIKRVGDFGTKNATDFTTPVPPNPAVSAGQAQATQLFADLSTPNTGVIARIDKNVSAQVGGKGSAKGGTTAKSVLQDALMLELRGINRTAAAIAEFKKQPQIMDQFRMPWGATDETLPGAANAMADAAAAMPAEFLKYDHAATFVADLRAHIADFAAAESSQSTGKQSEAGATAEFGPLIDEGLTKVKQLDAFIHQFYKSNAEKLAEWRTASHVERQKKKKEGDKPAKPGP